MTESTMASNAVVVTRMATKTQEANRSSIASLVKLMMNGVEHNGFVNAEIEPPQNGDEGWKLIQRFNNPQSMQAFLESQQRKQLMDELVTDVGAPNVSADMSEAVHEKGTVATAIVTYIKPGLESSFRDWQTKIQTAQATYPGYQGAYIQAPTPGTQQWVTLLRFRDSESLDNWFGCDERKQLLQEADSMVHRTEIQRGTSSSFPGWFPVDPETGEGPANWKSALLVILGLYPIVMLEIRFLSPVLGGMSITPAPANLIGNIISVSLTTWVTMPLCINLFKWWLFPNKDASKGATDLKGFLIVAALLGAEVAALWKLL